jgi:tyrosinase
MTLPKEAEVLGANSGALEIKGSGAHTIVKLTAAGQRKLAALISASAETAANSVYLGLENIRGDFDAAVLTAYINLPEDESARDHHNLRAEGVGLYGLRRASIRQGNNDGPGMTFLLDISQILVSQFEAKLLDVEEIPVRIVPDHPLPDSIKLVVGRVSIFTTSPGS